MIVAEEAKRIRDTYNEFTFPDLNGELETLWRNMAKHRNGRYLAPEGPADRDHGPYPGRSADLAASFAFAGTNALFHAEGVANPGGKRRKGEFGSQFIPTLIGRTIRNGIPSCIDSDLVREKPGSQFFRSIVVSAEGDIRSHQMGRLSQDTHDRLRHLEIVGFAFGCLALNYLDDNSPEHMVQMSHYASLCEAETTHEHVRVDFAQLMGMYIVRPNSIDEDTMTIAGKPQSIGNRLELIYHSIDYIRETL